MFNAGMGSFSRVKQSWDNPNIVRLIISLSQKTCRIMFTEVNWKTKWNEVRLKEKFEKKRCRQTNLAPLNTARPVRQLMLLHGISDMGRTALGRHSVQRFTQLWNVCPQLSDVRELCTWSGVPRFSMIPAVWLLTDIPAVYIWCILTHLCYSLH